MGLWMRGRWYRGTSVKIATWNVNGIRARQAQVQTFLETEQPDVLCLQEIKASPDQLPVWLVDLDGYWCCWHGDKGYSGVALHVRKAHCPDRPACSHPPFDFERRIVTARLPGLTVASVYVPNGGKDFDAKMRFLDALDAFAPPSTIVAVDMPMWFPVQPPRRSEVAAREVLGPRRASSIFPTPVRAAIEAPDHATANAVSREATGVGVSRQAFALAAKILEVDAWRSRSALDVREVHPETSFAVLLGRPAAASKRTWAGAGERRAALVGVGIDLTPLEGIALGKATVDDVLDAAVAAWTADRKSTV